LLGLNKITKDEILKYRDKTSYNDTAFEIVLTKDYGLVLFDPDSANYDLSGPDANAILNVTHCYRYSSGKCKGDIPFAVGRGAWFYIVPREQALKLISHLKS